MASLWDTTVASRLHPGAAAMDHVTEQALAGTPVRVAAPAVLEIAFGYQRKASTDPRYAALLAWFTRFLASGAFVVVPLDGRAALFAGRLRGALPHPPTNKRDRRSKPMRQAAWLLDIQIAATAFAAGLDVATENRSDFETLSATLVGMFPDAPPLAVVGAPR